MLLVGDDDGLVKFELVGMWFECCELIFGLEFFIGCFLVLLEFLDWGWEGGFILVKLVV